MKKSLLVRFWLVCSLFVFCFSVFGYASEFVFAESAEVALALSRHLEPVYSLVYGFCQIGGAIWIVLGTITLGGSLKDKNGPGLQSGIWQITGGTMVMYAAKIFRDIPSRPTSLNNILGFASKFAQLGGALWLVWGIIILGGAVKDKTGPALQSAIWQIVGGGMIMYAAELLKRVIIVG